MKKSFTLIEVLISIAIFSMLFLAMVNSIKNFDTTKKVLNSSYNKEYKNSILIKTLYNDILNAKYVKIKKSKNFDEIYLKTTNSLYNFISPYVIWYVSKKDKALIRVEDYKKDSLPNRFDNIDKFLDNVKIFKLYKNRGKYFVYIKANKAIYFEFYKGF